jgi:hypothetical protein
VAVTICQVVASGSPYPRGLKALCTTSGAELVVRRAQASGLVDRRQRRRSGNRAGRPEWQGDADEETRGQPHA